MKQLILAASFSFFLVGCGANVTTTTTQDPVSTTPDPAPITTTSENETMNKDELTTGTYAVFNTNLGEMVAEIYTEQVPSIAGNFVNLAKAGKYDGTIFHRVIPGFMIQGGDYENRNGTGGAAFEGGMIEDEFAPGLSHVRGTLSMANRGPNTNGSQFFIMHGEAPHLDGLHAIFGQVVEGMDTVDAIANTQTAVADKPVNDVIIEKLEILEVE